MTEGRHTESITALLATAKKSSATVPACATQVALAREGELLAFETFGRAHFGGESPGEREADAETLFVMYSVTKAIVSGATLLALQDGLFGLADRVAEYVPEFATLGKEAVTVEQLLTHTAGFPAARMPNPDWEDRERRLAHFAKWRAEWEPGSRFIYHGVATMWVLAELLTRCSGSDYRDFIRDRILAPLQLRNVFIGLPDSERERVADVISVGAPAKDVQRGKAPIDAPVIGEVLAREGNDPAWRHAGSPGSGGIATAADVALYYQALLADAEGRGTGLWQAQTVQDAWRIRNPELLDPMTQQPALRGLGFVMAGESGRIWRGFAEGCSARTFGHMGAGGQVSWADPESGLSFVFLTNGAQQDPRRQGANGVRLSTLAARCA
ncbi:MAG: serine hydrolase [Gammaproteobacteria bacterium]|nr:serine hydrolase [Gammaproteobacteria bacterium]